ncbi:MAG: hypothetical protein ACREFE_06220 [Limisphaerales bacterium]
MERKQLNVYDELKTGGMKLFPTLIGIFWLLPSTIFAQSPITLAIDTRLPGRAIRADFAGLSFETLTELPDRGGVSGHLFSPTNTQLVTLFTNSGIRNLRLGGGTVDGLHAAIPSRADIDSVFGFAKTTGIKVIYSLRLLDGNAADDAATAKYIWTHYHSDLDCFAIGNEPNEPPYLSTPIGAITNYISYLAAWRNFAAAIANAVPAAKFAGPDAGGTDWVAQFAEDESNSGMVVLITQHEYAGGKPFINGNQDEMPVSQAIDNMLSRNWVTNKYPRFYEKTLAIATANGLSCRMTEADDYLRGVTNASNAFASALWALDYLHWWAAHGCAGVNFHNNEWLKTDTVYLDGSSREYRINPKAYAIRAFDLGSHGRVRPVVIGNANGLNLTAYAVGDATNLYVTIINKEHGDGARDAIVTITPNNFLLNSARAMFLIAPRGDAGATNGITLGGASIANNAPWRGQWTILNQTTKHSCKVIVPATSVAVVKLSSGKI